MAESMVKAQSVISNLISESNIFFDKIIKFSKIGALFSSDFKGAIVLFLLAFLLAFSLRNEGLFHYDSITLANAVDNTFAAGKLQSATDGRYGAVILTSIIHFPFYLANFRAEFAVILAGVLFHALSIAFLWLWLRSRNVSRFPSIAVSLLLMVAPLYLSPNTYGKEHGMAVALFFAGLYFLECAFRTDNRWLFVFSSILAVGSLSVRQSMLVYLPIFVLVFFSPHIANTVNGEKMSFSFRTRGFWSVAISGVLMFAFLWFSYLGNVMIGLQSYAPAKFLGIFSPRLFEAWSDLFSTAGSWLMIIIVIIGFIASWMWNHRNALIFTFMFLLFFYFGNLAGYQARYLDVTLIAWFFFASFALWIIYRQSRWLGVVLLLFLVFSAFFTIAPLLWERHSWNGPKEFSLMIKNVSLPDEKIIVGDDAGFVSYYSNRKILGVPPPNDNEGFLSFAGEIFKELNANRSVFLAQNAVSQIPREQFINMVLSNSNFSLAFEKETEEYHTGDIRSTKYNQKVFKISRK